MNKEMKNYRIADIHMHCIPEVDDGAVDMQMAIKMIKSSYAQGVRTIFCTSHDSAYEFNGALARANFEQLKSECELQFDDITFYLGCELYCEPRYMDYTIECLEKNIFPSMNNTKYVLVEFGTRGMSFSDIKYCVERLIQSGWKPVIAHAERYFRALDGAADVKRLKDMGCLIQINAYSVVDEADTRIRELANDMIDEELVDFLGSDGHRSNHRPPVMANGVAEIYKRCRKEYADKVCWKNAESLGQRDGSSFH